MNHRYLFLFLFIIGWLVNCQSQDPAIKIVEVTREHIIEVTATPLPTAPPVVSDGVELPDDGIVICMPIEPESLLVLRDTSLASQAVRHAIFETDITQLSYEYQAHGLERLPTIGNGDAYTNVVEVDIGDYVVDSDGKVVILQTGVEVIDVQGEPIVFASTPIPMTQIVAEFTMKPRVWSDGTPVSALDSVYHFELATESDYTASYEAIDELTTRWAGLPGHHDPLYITNFWSPLPRHAWADLSKADLLEAKRSNRMPIGDGPFVIKEWVEGESIYLVRNEHYYRADQGMPYLDSVTYLFNLDPNRLIAMLLSGQCDIVTHDGALLGSFFFIPEEADDLMQTHSVLASSFEHLDFGINSYGGYGDGMGRPDWFEDVRVRQAIAMCVDRQVMVDNVTYGRSEVMHSYLSPAHPLYPETITQWPTDVAQANALLDEVGFIDTDGDGWREYMSDVDNEWNREPFVITLSTTTNNEMRQQISQIIKEQLVACGIRVNLNYEPASELFADEGNLFGRRFDLALFSWRRGVAPSCHHYTSSQVSGPIDEVNANHYQLGTPFAGWDGTNITGWVHAEYDHACEQAQNSFWSLPTYELGHQEAARIASEQLPFLPLLPRLKVALTRPAVLNFQLDPTQPSELHNIYELDLQWEE